MPNYNFAINSSFQPFTMQEMLTPLLAYKDAFEKTEESYKDLSDKSNKFEYLSETLPEGSKARQLYEGYAGELRKQAKDLAHNGLNMGNRRALTSLKRRYQGEIGRLLQADEAMKEEKKLRQSLNAQDSSRLYATDNLSIDDFLDGSSPNLYNISGNELYTRGAAAGKAASSRVFHSGDGGSTLGGYYRDYVQKMGYNRDTINRFYEDMSTIPELQRAADSILEERGVTTNLSGYNLERARKSVINGMIDGAIYQEQHNPQRDLGKLTAAENKQFELQKRGQDISLGMNGFSYNDSTGAVTYNGVDNDPSVQKAKALAVAKAATKNNSGGNGKGNFPQPNQIEYIADGGNVPAQVVEGIPTGATSVKIRANGSKYEAYVTDGDNEWSIGKIDANTGKISGLPGDTNDDYKNFGHYFRHGMNHWYQWGHTYDPDNDIKNIKAMLQDVKKRAEAGGGLSYMNFEYALEPDNVGYNNHNGGFYRKPINIGAGSVFNEDPNADDFDYGEHPE